MAIQNQKIVRIAIVVGLILLVLLFGNLFVGGWNWGILDFIIIGALLFATGLAIDYAVRKIANPLYRILAVIAIVMVFLLVWAELAVDAVSQIVRFLLA